MLLFDQTTQKNIFWATESYSALKAGFQYSDSITLDHITGEYGEIIRPRALKSRDEQARRVRNMAEVFTPSWICNTQNNLIDNAWFGRENIFNEEYLSEDGTHHWKVREEEILFPARTGKRSWRAYVRDVRLEMACGEGPYMVSRYDTVSGDYLPIKQRVGFLDRKLRVVGEHTYTSREWVELAKDAVKASYGFEWQGDSLLLARESVFASFLEYYEAKFGSVPADSDLMEVAEIISWNIWQMDGHKGVIPNSCHEDVQVQDTLFGGGEEVRMPCKGCETDDIRRHNGIYCKIMDWETGKPIRYIDLLK